jgi:nitroreductase
VSELDQFEELARRRRTSLAVDAERAVDGALVERLCTLATLAPNHKRPWPWRFAVFSGSGRDKLGAAFAADLVASGMAEEGRLAKTRSKYGRAPVVLLVGSAGSDKAHLDEENRHAVASGVQNLLLGATAAGLASFWSSPPVSPAPTVNALAGFAADVRLVAVVYLGWPSGAVDAPERPPVVVTHIE